MVATVLEKTGSPVKVRAMMHKAVIHSVLLYRSKIWLVMVRNDEGTGLVGLGGSGDGGRTYMVNEVVHAEAADTHCKVHFVSAYLRAVYRVR